MKHLLALFLLTGLAVTGLAADFATTVNDLIPKLANADVPKRYDAQMQLQALASNSSKPGNETDRAALGAVLAAKVGDASVPQPARVWIIRQLEYMGKEEAVPALTQLLSDEDTELRECARRALEKNPAPAAVASLRAALEKVAGDTGETAARWQIGLLHALGERRDSAATGLMVSFLKKPGTANAAALALAQLATDEAVSALWSVYPDNPFAGESLVNAADRRLARGDANAARAIFDRLNSDDATTALRAAALSGLIKAHPASAADHVLAGLTSNSPKLQQAVITAAIDVLGAGPASAILARALPKLSPAGAVQVLAAVDATAEPTVREMALQSEPAQRVAALEALGRMGSATSVPVLLRSATAELAAERRAATAALTTVAGPNVNAALLEAAGQGSPDTRVAAINVLASRNETSAVPALMDYARTPEATVRKAALAALSQLAGDNEIEPLARLALSSKDPEAFAALEATAERANDKPAAARKLLALADNDEKAKSALLKTLVALGGTEALGVVSKLTATADPKTQEAAVRALMNSQDYAAVPTLLAVAANPKTPKTQYILALAAVVRLIKTSTDQPAAQRAQDATAALNAARRDQEKRLALSALGAVPHAAAADTLKPWLAKAGFKAEATQAGIALVKLLAHTDAAKANELADAIKAVDNSPNVAKQLKRALRR